MRIFFQDKIIGYIGIWSIIGNCVTSILVSRIVDHLKGKMKITLIIIMVSGITCWIWLGLLCLRVIPFTLRKNSHSFFTRLYAKLRFYCSSALHCDCSGKLANLLIRADLFRILRRNRVSSSGGHCRGVPHLCLQHTRHDISLPVLHSIHR